eukprot:6173716-Pleurochrysis_carterae.AAC.1
MVKPGWPRSSADSAPLPFSFRNQPGSARRRAASGARIVQSTHSEELFLGTRSTGTHACNGGARKRRGARAQLVKSRAHAHVAARAHAHVAARAHAFNHCIHTDAACRLAASGHVFMKSPRTLKELARACIRNGARVHASACAQKHCLAV